MTDDRQLEQEIEFVDKKTSRRCTNEDSVIRATIHEHRAPLRPVNPAEKVSDVKKGEKVMISPNHALFRAPRPRARTQDGDGAEWRKQ